MKYALKETSSGKVVRIDVVSNLFVPEGFELIGEIPELLQDKKYLKLDVDEITLIEDADAVSKKALRDTLQEKERKGELFKALANKILHIIAGHNYDNSLDTAQILQMKTDHPEALGLLSDGQPFSAKSFIDVIVPDGTIITQEELDHVAEAYVMFSEENPDIII